MITLWPHQIAAIEECRRVAAAKAVLVVSPTGSGKTTIASEMARLAVLRSSPVLWLAHHTELVDQAFDRLTEFGLHCGAVSASSSRAPNPYAPVQVASIQTLLARKLRPQAKLVIWDEAHHTPSDDWSQLATDYTDAHLYGFTATPERSDGRGMGAIYKRIVVAATVRQLVDLGSLVPCDIRRPAARLRAGSIAKRPVDAYLAEARGRRAIVFSPSVPAAEEHASEFCGLGVNARVVHAKTPPAERAQLLADFRSGRLRVLVNVYVLTEGFDAPETDCVILARGCGTVGTYLQMVGRGLRSAPGKRDCILIDLHGVSHVHGHPADDRQYSLEGKGIRSANDDIEVDDCPSCRVCGAPTSPGEACAECGTEPKKLTPPKVANVELVRYAAKRAEGDDKRAATLARWIVEGFSKRYKPGWAYSKFRAVYGCTVSPEIEQAARRLLADEEIAA